ncbi:Beta-crystallin A3 [Myotis brandtii]|uniref:Beta-crystallin A3 n=1 Tax=Myotis brandtii TaxID=109478 RepID=S7NB95_MYOBR|nr:Beta-crystallin A3 [Myotis brandtii]
MAMYSQSSQFEGCEELGTLPTTKMAQTNPMPGSVGPWKITIYDQENFQGKRMEFTSSCPNVSERSFDNVRSLKVECGAKKPIGLAGAKAIVSHFILNLELQVENKNHKESKITIFEKENFIGRQWEICDDYPSLQAMGWFNNEVGSMKIQCGA